MHKYRDRQKTLRKKTDKTQKIHRKYMREMRLGQRRVILKFKKFAEIPVESTFLEHASLYHLAIFLFVYPHCELSEALFFCSPLSPDVFS